MPVSRSAASVVAPRPWGGRPLVMRAVVGRPLLARPLVLRPSMVRPLAPASSPAALPTASSSDGSGREPHAASNPAPRQAHIDNRRSGEWEEIGPGTLTVKAKTVRERTDQKARRIKA